MARGRAKLEWDQTALLWSLTANVNRDIKERPEPFLPSLVHPYRTASDYQVDEACKKARDAIKKTCKVKRLRHVNINNRGGQSVPAAAD